MYWKMSAMACAICLFSLSGAGRGAEGAERPDAGSQNAPAAVRPGEGDFLFIKLRRYYRKPYHMGALDILKVPLLDFDFIPRNFGDQGLDANPMKVVIPFDQPIFSLWGTVVLREDDTSTSPGGMNKPLPMKGLARRTRVLDSLIFSLYQKDKWRGGYYETVWARSFTLAAWRRRHEANVEERAILHSPILGGLYVNKTHATGHDRRFIDIPFITAWLDVETSGAREMQGLSFVNELAGVYRGNSEPGSRDEYLFYSLPLDLWHRSEKGSERRVVIGDSIDFFLWRSRERGEEGERREALCIPLLGPVWMNWRTGEMGGVQNARWTLFPRLQWWRRNELRDEK